MKFTTNTTRVLCVVALLVGMCLSPLAFADECPDDPNKEWPGVCGCGVEDVDTDGDGIMDCYDGCPTDAAKTVSGSCGCGVADTDTDGDGIMDCWDGCPTDPAKTVSGICGCSIPDVDADGDGIMDCYDGCPTDPTKTVTGLCGCHVPDDDSDGDELADCWDGCPLDGNKVDIGICGCGVAETDTDLDGSPDCIDECPDDGEKSSPGICGCGVMDTDTDNDGVVDCQDGCPENFEKLEPGVCGCEFSPMVELDRDGDGVADCNDECAADAGKVFPGICGCGQPDVDSDGDGVVDCDDDCVNDPNKWLPSVCGCGLPDVDTDGDGVMDCWDDCPNDPLKDYVGDCGCGIPDIDTDDDGFKDCEDGCPFDVNKRWPGQCGCGVWEGDDDLDENGQPNCLAYVCDVCPGDSLGTCHDANGMCVGYIPDTEICEEGTTQCVVDPWVQVSAYDVATSRAEEGTGVGVFAIEVAAQSTQLTADQKIVLLSTIADVLGVDPTNVNTEYVVDGDKPGTVVVGVSATNTGNDAVPQLASAVKSGALSDAVSDSGLGDVTRVRGEVAVSGVAIHASTSEDGDSESGLAGVTGSPVTMTAMAVCGVVVGMVVFGVVAVAWNRRKQRNADADTMEDIGGVRVMHLQSHGSMSTASPRSQRRANDHGDGGDDDDMAEVQPASSHGRAPRSHGHGDRKRRRKQGRRHTSRRQREYDSGEEFYQD